MSSSSSPLSSSGSESGHSRASTPNSEFSLHGDLQQVPTPKVFVRIPSTQWNSKGLNTIFNEQTVGGLLGIYLPRAANDYAHPVDDQFGWIEESISVGGRRVDYHLGTAPEGVDLSQLEVP